MVMGVGHGDGTRAEGHSWLANKAATTRLGVLEENTSSARDRGFCLRRDARPKSPDGLSPPVGTETDRRGVRASERGRAQTMVRV